MNYPYYHTVNEYYRKFFGEKVYKISLNAGMTCPNRDGTLGTGGCIFCSAGGSGDFAASPQLSVTGQIDEGIKLISSKYSGRKFIAYFQAFTNTYAPVSKLRSIFSEALNDCRICGLSVATRPDCLEDKKIELLKELAEIKPVWVELGLQTIRHDTAEYIRRGYTLDVFEDTFKRLSEAGIPSIIHVIIGLPGNTHDDYLNLAEYLAELRPHGVKIQLLHILEGTDIAADYKNGLFDTMTLEGYSSAVVDIISRLPKETVIYRITGDGPGNLLIAPLWSLNKKKVLNTITNEFKMRNTFQGRNYKNGTGSNNII